MSTAMRVGTADHVVGLVRPAELRPRSLPLDLTTLFFLFSCRDLSRESGSQLCITFTQQAPTRRDENRQ